MDTHVEELHSADSFMNSLFSSDISREDIATEVNRLETLLGIASGVRTDVTDDIIRPLTSRTGHTGGSVSSRACISMPGKLCVSHQN